MLHSNETIALQLEFSIYTNLPFSIGTISDTDNFITVNPMCCDYESMARILEARRIITTILEQNQSTTDECSAVYKLGE